ncbi:WD40/YVTN/BNR-like repeat-containing protein [Scleromatobacter humisilvae]|uniref:Glycoside hydrolase n=1 Tax=Scleromatobacter humisilvae TaxID=2897159 RepID=A0A9X1YKF7_9BURK|nr:sialidase family protein [Scleromatobacter humisilvae]MCK9687959.1 glycoside hydrolase [Scleromatobacter humisilvae]
MQPRLAALIAAALLAGAQAVQALTPPPPPPKAFPFALLARDRVGDALVSSAFDGLYRRGPGDRRWTKALDLPQHTQVQAFNGGDQGWFILIGDWRSRRMMRSTDGGRHWDAVQAQIPVANSHAHLYAYGAHAQLLVSTDRGSTWQSPGKMPGDADYLVVASPSALYVALRDKRFFRSEDGGRHWTAFTLPMKDGLLRAGPGGKVYVQGEEHIPRREEVQGTGLDVGVSRSDDGGRHWIRERFGEREADRPIDIMFANERFIVANEWTQVHRPQRLCVRDATHTGAWFESGIPEGIGDEATADMGARLQDDGVWFMEVAHDRIVGRRAFDLAGLPDEDTGHPRAH